ncbi:hypothetical protein NDU88_007035 [Pleurodeles waltl]|uniref:Uncharacterized protein n=1 Tax=Pleurodeles waltl TaxID=8319 RepID=A0AAV7U008_PLEWA|nr:hypothetical protein NDU88_007035 [Pleurodeles waltl]
MAAHRVKKDSTLKDMPTKVAARKGDSRTEKLAVDSSVPPETKTCADDLLVLVTQPFMKALFAKLHKDIAPLWDNVAADLKEARKEVNELGNKVQRWQGCLRGGSVES